MVTKYNRGYSNYALVAGFTEIGETLEETVEREVMEEVGLKVKNIKYYKSQPWGIADDILAGFYCQLDGSDEITRDEEELKIDQEFENNIFYEEFQRVSEGKNIINLKKLLKMDVSNETGDFKINLCHIPTLYFLDSDKDGLFTKKDFLNLSKIAEEKEKKYKRYEFTSQLQAHFTLLMSKKVCSEQGEAEFVSWLIKLVTGGLPSTPPKEIRLNMLIGLF